MAGVLTKSHSIERVIDLRNDLATTPHFIFVSKPLEYDPNDDVVPSVRFAEDAGTSEVYDTMVFGKKVVPSDLMFMVRRDIWTPGRVFDAYDFSDPNLYNKNFFTAVQVGSQYNVYKCLNNNRRAPSTEAPEGQETSSFITSDGYVWKYMYQFTDLEDEKFSTKDTMPCKIDPIVQAAAVDGTIDTIWLSRNSNQYTNWHRGTFTSNSIRVGGNDLLYALELPASIYNDFYNGCYMRIKSGPADGEYRRIVDYYAIGAQWVVRLESPFTTTPTAGSLYEVMPAVDIVSDGSETTRAEAMAIITPTNTVDYIEVLNPGRGYRGSPTANITVSSVVGLTMSASVRPIISPIGGHGSDAVRELGASNLSVGMLFNQDENGMVSAENDYRVIGLIKEPLFDGLTVITDAQNTDGRFLVGETVNHCKRKLVPALCQVSQDSHFIYANSPEMFNYLANNDLVVLRDGFNRFIAEVDYVSSESIFRIKETPGWSNTNCSLEVLEPLCTAQIRTINADSIILDSVSNTISNTVPTLVGRQSHTIGTINFANTECLTINGEDVLNFRVYNQLVELTGLYSDANTFSQDLTVSTGSGTAIVHSTVNDDGTGVVNVFDVRGEVEPGMTLTSPQSLTSFEITNKYNGWLKKNSGKIIYLENIAPVLRSQNTSELIKLVFGF